MGRIVCWFSCGVASAVATKLILAKYAGTDAEIVIARCIVRQEHQDNERFSADCEKWFGQKITNLIHEKFDGDIYRVFQDRKYMSGVMGAPCTMILKKEVRLNFELPTDTHVFGYCAEEENRWNDFLDANPINATAPLLDRGLRHADCLAMVRDAGIELPEMYKLGFKHNNCIGCVKSSGQGYWNKIRQHFPVQFAHAAEVSRRIGCKLIKTNTGRAYLDELILGAGNYQEEPEIQCGVFCEAAKKEINV